MLKKISLFFIFLSALVLHGENKTDISVLNNAARAHLVNLINIDTSQPEGRELYAARYIYKEFNKVGQDWDIYIPESNRANIIAVIKGDGTEKEPLILLSHMDTASAGEGWTKNPYKAVEEDGAVFGLGSTDAKNYTAIYLAVFNYLKENKITLTRDLVFMATADEEAGSRYGAAWLSNSGILAKYKNAYAINEGGSILHFSQDKTVFFVEAATKMYMDIKITAYAPGGHAATTEGSSVYELTRALDKLKNLVMTPSLNHTTRQFFSRISLLQDSDAKTTIDMLLSSDRKKFTAAADIVGEDPFFRTQLFDICKPTVLASGKDANTLSTEASAVLNCRLLPDTDPDVFASKIKQLYEDNTNIFVEVLEKPKMPFPVPSNTEDILFENIEKAAMLTNGSAVVVAGMIPASSDSEILRRNKITVYGLGVGEGEFSDDDSTKKTLNSHGPDEHIKLIDFEAQLNFVYTLVRLFAVK